MKVYAYMGDQWGCGSYRVLWPCEAAAAAGGDVTVVRPDERKVEMRVDRHTQRVVGENFPDDADVVILQRPTNMFMPQVIPILQARGVAVVVDMDDDLSRIHPANPAWKSFAPWLVHTGTGKTWPNPHRWQHAEESCRLADLVTVTTPALARKYGKHGRVQVIPNYVPKQYLAIPRRDSEVIGWGGSVHSHPHDLQQVGPAIARLVARGHRFITVGNKTGVARALGLTEDPGGPADVPLGEWPHHLSTIGVGIAPLADTQFNQAKSRLKPLEYAAVGVPAVASPADDYARFAQAGGCLLADRPRAWEGILRSLASSAERRAEQSERGREVAAANTIEGHSHEWLEAWAAAVGTRTKVTAGVA